MATHVNTDNIHNHVIWNSTNLKANRKWRDHKRSGKDIAKVSDRLCLENGLSVIKKDDERKNTSHEAWQENEGKRKINYKKTLQQTIDEVLQTNPRNLQNFLEEMQKRGYEVKQRKYLAFKKAEQKKFTRLHSLGDAYSEEALIERIAKPIEINLLEQSTENSKKDMSPMLDMEKVVAQDKGVGYERWVKKYNLRELAKTMSYLNENELTDYEVLKNKTDAIKEKREEIKSEIAKRNEKLDEIKKLQTIIVDYSKTRTIYAEYQKTGFSEKFKNSHPIQILV